MAFFVNNSLISLVYNAALLCLITARRCVYKARYTSRRRSVCPSVRHTRVLYRNG